MTAAQRPRLSWRAIDAALAGFALARYERGGRGPEAFDCWGLVLEARRRLGLVVPPDFASGGWDADAVAARLAQSPPLGWRRCELVAGAVVLTPSAGHAGIHLAGRIVHAHRRIGVTTWRLGAWQAVFGELQAWDCGDEEGERDG